MTKTTISLLLLLLSITGVAQSLSVNKLACEYLTKPVGVQTAKPVFIWQLSSGTRNTLQRAYQILVAESPEALNQNQGNVWDSGKVTAETSIQVSVCRSCCCCIVIVGKIINPVSIFR